MSAAAAGGYGARVLAAAAAAGAFTRLCITAAHDVHADSQAGMLPAVPTGGR